MPQHPPVPLQSDSDQGWFAGIAALADRALTQAGLQLAPSVQGDPDALAARAKKVHRAWFEAELRFQGHQSGQASNYPLVSTRQVDRTPSVSEKVALAAKDETLFFSLDRAKSVVPEGDFAIRPGSALSGERPLPFGAVVSIQSIWRPNQVGLSRDQRFGRYKFCFAEWAGQCAGPDEECPLHLTRMLGGDAPQFLWGSHDAAEWSPLRDVPPVATGSAVPAASTASAETAPSSTAAGSSSAESAGSQ